MIRPIKYAALGIGFFLLSTAFGADSVRVAAADPTSRSISVTVVNEPTVAATQSGTWTVGLAGTPTVNVASMPGEVNVNGSVSINGTPSVNVGSLPSVTVGNFPSSQVVSFASPPTVIVNDGAGRVVLQGLLTFDASVGSSYGPLSVIGASSPYTVTAGKRLVVDTISAKIEVPHGDSFQSVSLIGPAALDGTQAALYLVPVLLGTDGVFDSYVVSVSQKAYFESVAGGEIFLALSGPAPAGATGPVFAVVTVFGHEVSAI